ncbi:MAG: phospho-N-acetylmuramoyl-pentapeptide-transferase [Kiritimatiellae bacterium]|nr:phospho-N-acetylmuramoyl-pentapeptide-transferase [Kiritimatiellia bacterium]
MFSLLRRFFLPLRWGPLRLFESHLFLLGFATAAAALAVGLFLPRFFARLPRDRGKALVKDGAASAGKPTGAGAPMFLLALPALLLALPLDGLSPFSGVGNRQWCVVCCLALSMLSGWLDDKAEKEWSRVRKGTIDLVVAVLAALSLSGLQSVPLWLPFAKGAFVVPWPAYVAVAAPILWFTINATNCSDGVDGLAGTLTLLSLCGLSAILYAVVGHETVSAYLLVPHNPEGARWAVLCMAFAGATAGYLWWNANPSAVLMGDAGSRPLGLLVGVAALAAGNPFLVLVLAPVALVNGGSGLLKIAMLQGIAKLGFDNGSGPPAPGRRPCALARALRSVRFPLHDQAKTVLHWSNPQVLMRFTLLQAGLMPLLFLLLLKIR